MPTLNVYTDVASGQHTTSGENQWSVPTISYADDDLDKEASGLLDMPISSETDNPVFKESPRNNFQSGGNEEIDIFEKEKTLTPPSMINKYQDSLENKSMEKELKDLYAKLKSKNSKYAADLKEIVKSAETYEQSWGEGAEQFARNQTTIPGAIGVGSGGAVAGTIIGGPVGTVAGGILGGVAGSHVVPEVAGQTARQVGSTMGRWVDNVTSPKKAIRFERDPYVDDVQTMIGQEPDGIWTQETDIAWNKFLTKRTNDSGDQRYMSYTMPNADTDRKYDQIRSALEAIQVISYLDTDVPNSGQPAPERQARRAPTGSFRYANEPEIVKIIQQLLKTEADGLWGSETDKAWNTKFANPADKMPAIYESLPTAQDALRKLTQVNISPVEAPATVAPAPAPQPEISHQDLPPTVQPTPTNIYNTIKNLSDGTISTNVLKDLGVSKDRISALSRKYIKDISKSKNSTEDIDPISLAASEVAALRAASISSTLEKIRELKPEITPQELEGRFNGQVWLALRETWAILKDAFLKKDPTVHSQTRRQKKNRRQQERWDRRRDRKNPALDSKSRKKRASYEARSFLLDQLED